MRKQLRNNPGTPFFFSSGPLGFQGPPYHLSCSAQAKGNPPTHQPTSALRSVPGSVEPKLENSVGPSLIVQLVNNDAERRWVSFGCRQPNISFQRPQQMPWAPSPALAAAILAGLIGPRLCELAAAANGGAESWHISSAVRGFRSVRVAVNEFIILLLCAKSHLQKTKRSSLRQAQGTCAMLHEQAA